MTDRVLIIDDSEDDIEILSRFLAAEGTEVRGVSDSQQAERVFSEFEPDLVLLDLHMPEPDGLEILRRLRAARALLGFLPVVVLTGISDRARATRRWISALTITSPSRSTARRSPCVSGIFLPVAVCT